MIRGHGGNIHELAAALKCSPDEIIDMSSNVNPLGPPEGLTAFLKEHLAEIAVLPEADAQAAVSTFAERYDVSPDTVLAGNGTTQFIYTIPLALDIRRALILSPTYADYADACRMHDREADHLFCLPEADFAPDLKQMAELAPKYDAVFICNPNNPTGRLISAADLKPLCTAIPKTVFIIDESYLPFTETAETETMIRSDLPNVLILNSMSKIFRVPGLRIGFVKAPAPLAQKLERYQTPWAVNGMAQAAIGYLMRETESIAAFVRESVRFLAKEREKFAAEAASPSLRFFPSRTSFLLAELGDALTAPEIVDALSREKILIRNCANFNGLSERFVRISLKTGDINRLAARKIASLTR